MQAVILCFAFFYFFYVADNVFLASACQLVIHLVKTGLVTGDLGFASGVADGLAAVEGGQNSSAVADHTKADDTVSKLIHGSLTPYDV